jgi:hypothetical protein
LRFEDDLLEQIIGADDAFAADVDMGVPNYAGVLGDDDDDDDSVSVDGDDDDSTAADDTGLDQEPEADSAIAGDDSDPDAAESQRRAKSDVEPDLEGLGERDSDTRDVDDQPEED